VAIKCFSRDNYWKRGDGGQDKFIYFLTNLWELAHNKGGGTSKAPQKKVKDHLAFLLTVAAVFPDRLFKIKCYKFNSPTFCYIGPEWNRRRREWASQESGRVAVARERTGAAEQEPGEKHQRGGRWDHAAQGEAQGSPAQAEVECWRVTADKVYQAEFRCCDSLYKQKKQVLFCFLFFPSSFISAHFIHLYLYYNLARYCSFSHMLIIIVQFKNVHLTNSPHPSPFYIVIFFFWT